MYPNHSTLLGLVVLPRPSILAKPGSVILWGRPVTFVCRGPPRVDIFCLQKRGKLSYVDVKNHLRLKTEAEFPITSVSEDTAGLYRCIYYKQSNWSKYSEFLKLEVIGAPGDISPSPTEADSVTGNGLISRMFQDYGRRLPRATRLSQLNIWLSLGQRIQVQPGERPGSPSSLLTQWGPIVASAESLILQCHSDVKYDRFTLSKEGTRDLPQGLGWQPQRGNSQVDFPLGRVNRTHKGQYSGYNLSQEWLVPSDPLDILVAEPRWRWGNTTHFLLLSRKAPYIPSLSAHSAPDVASGENVTLQCHSWSSMDTFLLSKEAGVDSPLHLRSVHQAGMNQAYFTMGPVTSGHMGTYRRYGSLSISPYLLSYPSGPLNLKVSASTSKSYTVGNCVRMGLAGMVLLIPVVILAEAGNSQCRSQHGCMGWRQAGATRD
ncbi:leukocyte immunoglobulin-like receptor subfamily A member 6 isoform X3 [Loxodonta africana]|uniref:leukocyte immunoglobulin-like receptor subfamily A member 6 isoform X3 n=1 Tax=Loxodonta africana TaxID=9785 RepID=UPI0030D58B3D